MRTTLCFMLAFFLYYPTAYAASEETVMVAVEEEKLEDVLQYIHTYLPKIDIRSIFQETFYGISIQGESEQIKEVAGIPHVETVSPVTTFQVDVNESIPFIMGKVTQEFRNKHLTGKGIKVGIIDTGIDYHHPDLKGNYKGGYDTIDSDEDPMETTKNQGIPTVHGTHVAGIIAANGKMKGIAPQASIYAYRALGPGGVGTTESVVKAIEKAVEDKVDIINLSLGNDVNGPDWPTSIALNKVVEKGIVAVTASGNSGPKKWTVGSPGTSSQAISVGASSPPMEIPFLRTSWKKQILPMEAMRGSVSWGEMKGNIMDGDLGDPASLKKAKGKIALIERGRLSFTEKAENAQLAGAKAVIVYNNVAGSFVGKLERQLDIPVVAISKENGMWLQKEMKRGNKHVKTIYRQQVDKLASFSSRGPVTVSWEVKPDIVAPGVGIYSTVPNGYMSFQGTSMASPHVAGAIALLKQQHPTWKPHQLKAALMNTTKELTKGNGDPYHVYEQGTGRIQVDEAIETETLVYPSAISLGIMNHRSLEKKECYLFIENVSSVSKEYTFSVEAEGAAIQWEYPKKIAVKAGEKKKVKLVMTTDKDLKKGTYEGEIAIQEEKNVIRVPYLFFENKPNYPSIMGFHVGHKKEKVWEYEFYLPEAVDEFGIALYDPATFTFHSYLDLKKNVARGVVKKKIVVKEKLTGVYKAIIFAKKGNKEDAIETYIDFSS